MARRERAAGDPPGETPAAARGTAHGAPVRVLFVCMGNICRSPLAEAICRSLAQRLVPQLVLQVDSAGTHGYHVGRPPDVRAQEVARARGLDLSGLRARQLVREDFERFDWILVMDEDNHAAALALAPPGQRARLRLLLDFAPHLSLREVPDPYYGGLSDFERVYELTEQAVRGLLQALAAALSVGPRP